MDNYLSVDEIATLLHLPTRTIYEYLRNGTGPKALKIGRHYRIDPKDFDSWIDNLKSENK